MRCPSLLEPLEARIAPAAVGVMVADVQVVEGDGGTKTAVFNLTLESASTVPVKFTFHTVAGTAESTGDHADFTGITGGTVTVPANQLTATVPINIAGDLTLEANEQFQLILDSVVQVNGNTETPATFTGTSDLSGTATIQNDDPTTIAVGVMAASSTLSEGDGSGGTANFHLTLSTPSAQPVTVSYRVNGSTDLSTAIVPAYTSSFDVSASFTQDDVVGHDQQLMIEVVSATADFSTIPGATLVVPAATKTAKTTVLEDDAFLTVTGGSKTEGNSGTSKLPFTVSLVDEAGQPVTLDHDVSFTFATSDGTGATAAISPGTNADFKPVNGTFKITAGKSSLGVDVDIRGDRVKGVDESFTAGISSPSGAALKSGSTTASGTIMDDDAGSLPVLTFEPSPTTAEGGPVQFVSKLSKASDSPVVFQYATELSGTASASDIMEVSATTFTIPSGEFGGTISVATTQDTINEGAETFHLNLTDVQGADGGTTHDEIGTIAVSDRPTLTITSVPVVEGNSGSSNLQFIVKLSEATNAPVTFNAETSDNATAEVGVDYEALSSTPFTIPAGETQVIVNVKVFGDTVAEADETIGLDVTSITNAIGDSVSAVGTIRDDEGTFRIASADANAMVSEDGKFATFTITRTGSFHAGTVTYQTMPGTAVSNGDFPDFEETGGTVTFAESQTSAIIKIPLFGDKHHEGNQQFSVQLTSATGGIISAVATENTAAVTLVDNDPVPTARIVSAGPVVEGDSGTKTMNFVITLNGPNEEGPVTFKFSTMDGTAVAGRDYTGVTDGTVTFAAGETEKTITITITNDLVFDSARNETFQVKLTNEGGSATFAKPAHAIGTGTIIDNESAPTLSITNTALTEGGAGTPMAVLSNATEVPVSFKFYTLDGTAVSGSDFTGVSKAQAQTLTIAPFTTSIALPITASEDAVAEGSENFTIKLVSPTGAKLNPAHSTELATIADNDTASLEINDVVLVEGDSGTTNAVFTVSLTTATSRPVAFDYATIAGTALAGSDFQATTGSLTIGGPDGVSTVQISIPVNGDLANEGSETFQVKLSNAVGATITRDTGTATIQNGTDVLAPLTISNGTIVEGNGSTSLMKFTATLPANPSSAVTFKFSTEEIGRLANSAQAGIDFTTVNGQSVTIPTTASSVDFFVPIIGDTTFETIEFFKVNITDAQGAAPVQSSVTGTIHDSDFFRSATVAKWTDADGDLVTFKTSKGNLFLDVLFFKGSGTVAIDPVTGGRLLSVVDLQNAGKAFNNANITITAASQPDATGALTGDGRVNVGYIKANNLEDVPTALELKGIDLGTVTIDGDLSRIIAGDLFNDSAVRKLDVRSLGVNPSSADSLDTTALVPSSVLVAGAGSIEIAADLAGQLTTAGVGFGNISRLTIGGALKGGALDNSGRINLSGKLGTASIGAITGGAGDNSGSISGSTDVAALGRITVLGDVTGGAGVRSGTLIAPRITSVAIEGSLHGSTDDDLQLGGFILGQNSLGSVTVDGNVDLGAMIIGTGLANNKAIGSVIIHGNVSNADILGGFTYGESGPVVRNADAQISYVQIDGTVAQLDIAAGAEPGALTGSGAINQASVFSKIAQVVFNGTITANASGDPHYITAQAIGTITVQGAAKTSSLAGDDLGVATRFFAKRTL